MKLFDMSLGPVVGPGVIRADVQNDIAPMPDNATLLPDDPEWDATDFAHPAWWRGNDAGADAVVRRLEKVLDGKDEGAGVLGGRKLEAIRRRLLGLLEMVKRKEVLGWIRQVNLSEPPCVTDDCTAERIKYHALFEEGDSGK